jgi:NAD(P)-dependent dehydrogenase (short-subunit alcohol dehydrogenase family)
MHSVDAYEQLGLLHPVGHMGEISDVVEAILYLEWANFVTSEILHVDGGQSAQATNINQQVRMSRPSNRSC